jgi:hypothetical protein
LSQKPEKIQIQIKYKNIEQQFSAGPQEAWLLVNQFFKEFIPSFEIAQKLWLNVDLQQLAKDLDGIVAFSNEGTSLMAPKAKLTDNEALSIWLVAQHLGNQLGMITSDSLSKDDLQVKLGKNSKIISTRLGELAKNGIVAKTENDRFRITTYGIIQTQTEVIPRIKQKQNPNNR